MLLAFLFILGQICDQRFLYETKLFTSRQIGQKYTSQLVRFAYESWCPWISSAYLLLDLQEENRYARVVVTTKNQEKLSRSYLTKDGLNRTYKNREKVYHY